MKNVLTISGLTVCGAGDHEILSGVEMALQAGQILGLVGETGSGKTTLINSVLGLLPPGLHVVAGSVTIEDEGPVDLLSLEPHDRRRYLGLQIGYVPQDVRSGLNPLMTARATVLEGALRQAGAQRERTEMALRRAGLSPQFLQRDADRRPGRLSGGQCQRVLIAQAIVNNPRVLLLDEPTASLDVLARRDVLDTIRQLADDRCAVCLVTHDIAAVAGVADMVAVMYAGRVVEYGRADQVLVDPLHPYTRALLDCVPRLDRRHRIMPIAGEVALSAAASGCTFHPRCGLCQERCRIEIPDLREIQSDRRVACHIVETSRS